MPCIENTDTSNRPKLRARAYSPTLMRWMQQDPLGAIDGLNLYGFVGGNPIAHVDSTGLFAISFDNSTPSMGLNLDPVHQSQIEIEAMREYWNAVQTQSEVPRLIRDLGRDEFSIREQAQRALERYGERALPYIVDAMSSRIPEVQARAEQIYDSYMYPLDSVTVDKNVISVGETATVTVRMKPNWKAKLIHFLPRPFDDIVVPYIKQSVNVDGIIDYETVRTIPEAVRTYKITGLEEGEVELEVSFTLYDELGVEPYLRLPSVGPSKKVKIRVCK